MALSRVASRGRVAVSFLLLAAMIAVGLIGFGIGTFKSQADPRISGLDETAIANAEGMSAAFRHAAERTLPAVVQITNRPARQPRRPENGRSNRPQLPEGIPEELAPFFRRFFDEDSGGSAPNPREFQRPSSGSGVIIDPTGYVLTNNHVVAGNGDVVVRLADGREFTAKDVKTDPATDIAIIKIESDSEFPFAKLGDSDRVQVGDWVLALGQPFGLANTITAGIISYKGRGIGITEHEEFLQTDAAINPGNSGGPLINLRGEIVGVNTAISTTSGGYQGVGFAVPVNVAKWVTEQLRADGAVHRAYLGVGIQEVNQDLARQLGMKTPQGVLVTEVREGSPAEKAGLKVGDVIVEFANSRLRGPRELSAVTARTKIGTEQNIVVLRDGRELKLQVVTKEMPEGFKKRRNGGSATISESETIAELGAEVTNLSKEVADRLGLTAGKGVAIVSVSPDGLAAEAGLGSGMVIERVGPTAITSVEDLRKAIKDGDFSKGVLFLIRTADGSQFVVIRKK